MSHYLYASQMWRAQNCPGSVKATRKEKSSPSERQTLEIEWTQAMREKELNKAQRLEAEIEWRKAEENRGTPEAEYGRELHKMAQEVIDGKLELEQIPEPERAYIQRCIDFLKGRELKGETETPLFVLVKGELVASCRADLVSVGESDVTIPDWKFYRAPLEKYEWEAQGITMCAAALQEHKSAHWAVAIAYLPILDTTYEIRLARELLEEAVLQIYHTFLEANKEDPELHAGAWCARCEALTTCPAAAASISSVASAANFETIRTQGDLPTVKVMERHFLSEIEKWSRGRFLGYVELLPFLQPLVDMLKKRLHRDLEKGNAHTHWKLTEKRNNRKGSVLELRRVLGDRFTSEEIDAMCSPRIGDVQKALAAQGMTYEEIDTLLEPFDQGRRDQLMRVH